MVRLTPIIVALLSACTLSGCAEAIARRAVRAPNYEWADEHRSPELATTSPATLDPADPIPTKRIAVDCGSVSLRIAVVEPTDAPWMPLMDTGAWIHAWPPRRSLKPLGTLVLLHGLGCSMEFTAPHAAYLANAGFRCVLIDLRGHGESTGGTVSFGRHEAEDIRTALSRLQADGTLQPPVALVGFSMGGSVALMTAALLADHHEAHDPTLAGVVAVAPFARLRDVAPLFANHFVGWLSWLVSDGLTDDVVAAMGRQAGFSPIDDSPLAWAPRVRAPVLIVHGADDDLVPPEQSARLALALGGPVQFWLIRGYEHIAAVLDPGVSLPTILPWLAHLMAPDAYCVLNGPLCGWVGTPDAPWSATWAWRSSPTDHSRAWPRPAGQRNIRTWQQIPPSWLGRDLEFELGTIDGTDQTWCGPLLIGSQNIAFPLFRRYPVPGWMALSHDLSFTIHLTTTTDGAGIRWAAGGTSLLRPALPPELAADGENQREGQPQNGFQHQQAIAPAPP